MTPRFASDAEVVERVLTHVHGIELILDEGLDRGTKCDDHHENRGRQEHHFKELHAHVAPDQPRHARMVAGQIPRRNRGPKTGHSKPTGSGRTGSAVLAAYAAKTLWNPPHQEPLCFRSLE